MMPCNHGNYNHLTRDMRLMVLITIILYVMYLVNIIIINFKKDINRSFPELRLPGF